MPLTVIINAPFELKVIKGTTMTTDKIENALRHRLGDVKAKQSLSFGNWEVKEDGEIIYHGNEIGPHDILPDELEDAHLTHLIGKFRDSKSDDAAHCYFAYLQALRNAGYKSLTIDLQNIHNFKFEK